MTFPPWSAVAAGGVLAATIVAWNLAVGSSDSTLPGRNRAFRTLTGLSAFLMAPALVIGWLAPTADGARVLTALAWAWPLVTLGMALQAAWALVRRYCGAWQAIPMALLDALVAWIAAARWIESLGAGLPAWALAPGVALSSIGETAFGGDAYLWSAWMLLPILAPAAPARSSLRAAWRVLLASWCSLLIALVGAEILPAYHGLRAARLLGQGLLTERSRADFAIGLHLFGDVNAIPSAARVRHDLALSDSLGVGVDLVTITPEGASGATLDSLARALEDSRDSLVLVVSLPFDRADAGRRATDDARWFGGREALVERVILRLHPDVLLPAGDLPPDHDANWWKGYYVRVGRAARQADRNVTLALATGAATPLDSTLCDWVGQADSPLDAIALDVPAGTHSAARFGNATAALSRWMSLARTPSSVWLVGIPSAPAVDGDVVQAHLIRQALQWASAHPWVRGVIAGDASDTWASTGLRTASGRSRRALAEVAAMLRSIREAPAPTLSPGPPAPPAPPAATARGDSLPSTPTRP